MAGVDIFPAGHSGDIYRRYSNRLFNCAAIGANAIRKAREQADLRDDSWVSILFEFLFFYIALTGEQGLADSDIKRRERVIGELLALVIPAAVDYLLDEPDDNAGAKVHLLSQCRQRGESYKRHSGFFPEPGEDMKGTALGALCARISHVAGAAGDPALVVTCQSHVLDSVDLLDMDIFAAMAEA